MQSSYSRVRGRVVRTTLSRGKQTRRNMGKREVNDDSILNYTVEFVVLEHGYGGNHYDMEHVGVYIGEEFRKLLRGSRSGFAADADDHQQLQGAPRASSRSAASCETLSCVEMRSTGIDSPCCRVHKQQRRFFVVLNHPGNDGWSCFPGIIPCGEKLANYVMEHVDDSVKRYQQLVRHGDCRVTQMPDTSAGCCKGAETRSDEPVQRNCFVWSLVFHFVGFSMGGLILRAALPRLQAAVERRYTMLLNSNGDPSSAPSGQVTYKVEWKHFFSLSSPHAGSRVAHPFSKSTYKLITNLHRFHLLPKVLQDMTLQNDELEKGLLQPSYLRALRRVDRKVFLGTVGDSMVWNYSSSFFLPTGERFLLDGWEPSTSAIFNYTRKKLIAEELVRRERGRRHQQFPMYSLTLGAAQEASASRNDPLSLHSVPWFQLRMQRSDQYTYTAFHNGKLLDALGIHPAKNLTELERNGLIISQNDEHDESAPQREGAPSPALRSDPRVEKRRRLPRRSSFSREHAGNWITEQSWPSSYLPRERKIAARFLRAVGPVELHMFDAYGAVEHYCDEYMMTAERHDKMIEGNFFLHYLIAGYAAAHGAVLNPYAGYEPLEKKKKRLKMMEKETLAKTQRDEKGAYRDRVVSGASTAACPKKHAAFTSQESVPSSPQLPFDFVIRYIAKEVVYAS